MPTINLTITAEAPLAIGRNKPGGNVSETERYIPGGVIRGAIASQILRKAGAHTGQDLTTPAGNDFQSLFLDASAAVFRNAYPAIAKEKQGRATVTEGTILVLPATALSSKAKGGFKQADEKNTGVFDSLIDRFCTDAFGLPYDFNCPEDGDRVEPYSGFYCTHTTGQQKGQKKSQKKGPKNSIKTIAQATTSTSRLLTRASINRKRATAEDAMLYSMEVINETEGKNNVKAQFRSSIDLPANTANTQLAVHLVDYINKHRFRFGSSGSRGLGRVTIKAKAHQPASDVQQRVNAFNQALQTRWNEWREIFGAIAPEQPKRTYFTVDLQSDAILTERWRRTTVLTEPMLQAAAGVSDNSLRLEVAHSSYTYSSGWNSAWGLMKDVDLVTNKGGCYLFSTEQPKAWEEAWVSLEARGIGDRTPEGFGQVLICHPFHVVLRENAL